MDVFSHSPYLNTCIFWYGVYVSAISFIVGDLVDINFGFVIIIINSFLKVCFFRKNLTFESYNLDSKSRIYITIL